MKLRYKALPVVLAAVLMLAALWTTAAIAEPKDLPLTVSAVDGGVVEAAEPAAAPAEPAAAPAEPAAPAAQAAQAAQAAPAEAPATDGDQDVAGMKATGGLITHWPLHDAPIRVVLRQLSMMSQRNIISSPAVKGTVTADLFNITFREALDAVLSVNGFGYIEKGNFIYVYTQKELEAIKQSQRKMATKVFSLYYINTEDVKKLIGPCMSSEGRLAGSPTASGDMGYAGQNVLVVRDYEENLGKIADMLEKVDRRPQQVLIEATILRTTLDEGNKLGIDFAGLPGVDLNTLNASTDFAVSKTAGTSGGLSMNFLGITDMSIFLHALEEITDTNVLANPKLLVIDGQEGSIHVGDKKGYRDMTNTTDTGGTTTSVSFLNTGTELVIRPIIGKDGYVRLEVAPKDSSGSVDVTGLPSETTTECISNIMVKDGHTIVISGLFRDKITKSRNQVPVLGNIPGLGAAFRSTGDDVVREEVIILITPRIIKEGTDDVVSEQLRNDVERFRLGMRQNLGWWGRTRLANMHVSWAKQHLANGNTKRAMWDTNLALSMSPAMYEALLLKEKITGKALWANEPQESSVRWIIQKMIMNELGLEVAGVIMPGKPLDYGSIPKPVRESMGMIKTSEPPAETPSDSPSQAVEAVGSEEEPKQ